MNDVTKRVMSGLSGDGFNERRGYINRNNDLNRINKNISFDQSLAKQRIAENKPDIETVDSDKQLETLSSSDTSMLRRNIDMYQNRIRQNINK